MLLLFVPEKQASSRVREAVMIELKKSYITDEAGHITNVILDYVTYQRIEALLLDQGLLHAMEEIADEDTVDYQDVK